MKARFLLIISMLLVCNTLCAQKRLTDNLRKGEKQTIVVYGTSLSARPDGWPAMLQDSINAIYHNSVEVINSAKGAMWSTWGVQNLDERVLAKQPDMVLIEFGMNDAYLPYKTSLEASRINLEYMIDRIKEAYPLCEIVIQVMNMPIREHLEARPRINDYYNLYRKTAKKHHLKLIDHYKYWMPIFNQGEEEFLRFVPDGIHPDRLAWQTYTVPFILHELGIKKNAKFSR
ncbi:MAG: SGNH/GDSL hydrolase family protein [Muribaculaceae bacterium]